MTRCASDRGRRRRAQRRQRSVCRQNQRRAAAADAAARAVELLFEIAEDEVAPVVRQSLRQQPDGQPRWRACSFRVEPLLEPVGHRRERAIGVPQRRDARGRQRVELASSAAALRGRLADPRSQQPFALEPVERRVDGVDRDVTPRARVDLLPDGRAVGVDRRAGARPRGRAVRSRRARAVDLNHIVGNINAGLDGER